MFKLAPHKYIGFLFLIFLSGCNEQEKHLFSQLDSDITHIDFANRVENTEYLNIVQYLYANNGGGVAIGDINKDGLADIYFTANQLPNKLYLNEGNFIFRDITETAGVGGFSGSNSWTNGVTMADVNGDGLLDIYVSVTGKYKQFYGHNQLFINNGDLTFKEASKEYNLDIVGFSQQAFFFDYDLDGDLDMYQLKHAVHKPEVYVKRASRTKRDSLSGDVLLKNENNKFIDVSDSAGIYGGAAGYGLSGSLSDIDNNGCPDIYISNDFHENDFLYYNNCDGTFTENGSNSMGHTSRFSMGNDISDLNNDGLFDIISLDMKPYNEEIRKKSEGEASFNVYEYRQSFGYQYQYARNMFQLNRGQLLGDAAQFSEIGQQSGMEATDWSWGPLVADFDNDGWKDLFITNGIPQRPNDLDYINFAYNEHAKQLTGLELTNKMPDGATPNFAYKNNHKLGFTDVSEKWGINFKGYSMGAAYGDLDNDGDLDIVINNLNSKATILKNNSREIKNGNFLRVKLNGADKNRFGVGAKIAVQTKDLEQFQEIFPTRGWLSSVDPTVHFGLGKKKSIDSVKIVWPDGAMQILTDVPINSTLELNRKEAVVPTKNMNKTHKPLFKEVLSSGIGFVHQENAYTDFESERLMPHKLSNQGPKLALGDINGDSLTDFYICGAKGQSGELYRRTGNENPLFQKVTVKEFSLDKDYEDTAAAFFDADGDGDLDLYVVSGGGEYIEKPMLADRLYINNGKGEYARAKEATTANSNGSTVVAGDFDGDGYTDLFVGARSVVGSYGLSPASTILWNQGNHEFLPDTAHSNLLKLGMITDAVFMADSRELVIVGEWMPITVLKFNERALSIKSLPHTSGWWNTIHANDMDGDGDTDFLVGNNGTNSILKPTAAQPLGLYVKDFDGNSSMDPLITYWHDDKEWLFVGLDELKSQIVSIRKQMNRYEDYAGQTFQDIMTDRMRKNMVHKQVEIFESVYMENIGSGNFNITPLPAEVQWSPIFGFATADFDGDAIIDILSVGNFYENQPYIGRADASYGNFLKGDGKGRFLSVEPRNSGWVVNGEGRDLKLIEKEKGNLRPLILVSRNNDSPLLVGITK